MISRCNRIYDVRQDLGIPHRIHEPSWFEVPGLLAGDTSEETIDMALKVISSCPRHTFVAIGDNSSEIIGKLYGATTDNPIRILGSGEHLSNLWIGLKVTSQKEAKTEIPGFVQAITARNLLYIEPAEEIDLIAALDGVGTEMRSQKQILPNWLSRKLEWVIVSGYDRPIHPQWVKGLKDQCIFAGVPFWFDSWGDYAPRHFLSLQNTISETADEGALKWGALDINGDWYPYATPFLVHRCAGFARPRECTMYLVGKDRSGCLLEGREWKEMPEEKDVKSNIGRR